MKKKFIKNEKIKEESHYEEAKDLFITGLNLENIAEKLPVSLDTLKEWQAKGYWERKKQFMAEHPKLISDLLKGLVRQKLHKLMNNSEEININQIDELNKILGLIEKLAEHAWDERAAIVEVMSLFGNFIRRQACEREELELLAKLMERFFEEIEGT